MNKKKPTTQLKVVYDEEVLLFKKDVDKYTTIINRMKKYLKMSDWEFTFSIQPSITNDSLAQTEVNFLEKSGTIILSYDFMEQKPEYKANILLHELMHLKFSLVEHKLKSIKYETEEEIVNDLTKGLEDAGVYKLEKLDKVISSLSVSGDEQDE